MTLSINLNLYFWIQRGTTLYLPDKDMNPLPNLTNKNFLTKREKMDSTMIILLPIPKDFLNIHKKGIREGLGLKI